MFHRKFLQLSRRRLTFFLIPSLLISFIFIIYQISIFIQLSNETKLPRRKHNNLIRGVHDQEERFYKPDGSGFFTCIRSMEKIDIKRINDDYCDCLDGSDEPGTNACKDSNFHCGANGKVLQSSKVNDGICDCCDGSDEWRQIQLGHGLDRILQKKLNRFQAPCPDVC